MHKGCISAFAGWNGSFTEIMKHFLAAIGLVAVGATDVHVPLRAFNRDPADAPAVFADMVRRFADAAS